MEEPPLSPGGALSLWLSADVLPPDPVDLGVVFQNRSAGAGVAVRADATVVRWAGSSWEPARQAVLCPAPCVGELYDLDERVSVRHESIEATAAGHSDLMWLRLQGLRPGWYELRSRTDDGSTVSGRFRIDSGAPAPAPAQGIDGGGIGFATPFLYGGMGTDLGIDAWIGESTDPAVSPTDVVGRLHRELLDRSVPGWTAERRHHPGGGVTCGGPNFDRLPAFVGAVGELAAIVGPPDADRIAVTGDNESVSGPAVTLPADLGAVSVAIVDLSDLRSASALTALDAAGDQITVNRDPDDSGLLRVHRRFRGPAYRSSSRPGPAPGRLLLCWLAIRPRPHLTRGYTHWYDSPRRAQGTSRDSQGTARRTRHRTR